MEDPCPPRRLNRAIPVGLETIVAKAMEKNPSERYATAQELAADLRRFLENKPIHARRPSLWQRTRKFIRRHQPVVATASLAMITVLIVFVAMLTFNIQEV